MNTAPQPPLVGRAFGIPVYLHLSWVIVFGLIAWTLATGYFPAHDPDRAALSYWLEGLLASALLFGSTFLHEMAHALTARAAALEIRSVTLFMFGGVAEMPREPEDGPTELRIAAAGPLASLALAGLFGLAAAAGPPRWDPSVATWPGSTRPSPSSTWSPRSRSTAGASCGPCCGSRWARHERPGPRQEPAPASRSSS